MAKIVFITTDDGKFITTEDDTFFILDVLFYPIFIALSESVEFGVSLSETTEYNIALSEIGGGE